MATANTKTSEIEVLVVGGGTTGLLTALGLVQNGVAIRVIDKEPHYAVGGRAWGVQPRTLESHRFLNTLPDILDAGRRAPFLRTYEGTVPVSTIDSVEYTDPTPAVPNPNAYALSQERHQAVMRDHLAKSGVKVELGVELVSLEQTDDGVVAHLKHSKDGQEVHEDVKALYLVGSDGAHSKVRKELGLSFVGDYAEKENIVTADIEVKSGLDHEYWHAWGNTATKRVLLVSLSRDPNEKRFMVQILGKELDHARIASGREELVKTIYEISGRTDIELGNLVWVSNYRPSWRMVDKFRVGRVFLVGDAAHTHSPAGGQGMNSGVQDSFNIAWKLALAIKGKANSALLNSYNDERVPVIASMLNLSTSLHKELFDPNAVFTRRNTTKQLSVTYRSSPIILDEVHSSEELAKPYDPYRSGGQGDLHAGDRAPDAPGIVPLTGATIHALFDLFRYTHHTVLLFNLDLNAIGRVGDIKARLPQVQMKIILLLPGEKDRYEDSEKVPFLANIFRDKLGHAHAAYNAPADEPRIVVVRPDAVVGAIVKDVDRLAAYFDSYF